MESLDWMTEEEQNEQPVRLLRIGVALAGYRHEHGAYPAKLDALVPGWFKEIPGDLFSGKPPIYRRTATGYLLYSVGVDGQDDGGHDPNDVCPEDGKVAGSDIVLRVGER